jgi:hypothetical protein
MREHFIDCEGEVKKTNYNPWNGKGIRGMSGWNNEILALVYFFLPYMLT